MNITPVTYRELLDDPAWPALEAEYSAECSLPELGSPNPQRHLYAALEASGGLQCFGVYRDGLHGFLSPLIYTLPHYGKKMAATESLFLSRSQRCGRTGMEMLDFFADYAKAKDCAAAQIMAPVGSRLSALLSAKSEYRHSNNVFVRGL